MTSSSPTFLVPMDGSLVGEKALHAAKEFAGMSSGRLILFRVALPPSISVMLGTPQAEPEEMARAWNQTAEAYLNDHRADVGELGLECTVEVQDVQNLEEFVDQIVKARLSITQQVGRLIADRAARDDVDMVFLSTHGETADPAISWGSVLNHVLTLVDKPVVVVPAR